MRTTMILLVLLLVSSLSWAAGGSTGQPGEEELVNRIGQYQLCVYLALPEAMVQAGSNDLNPGLAERASIMCREELASLEGFLAKSWKDPDTARTAAWEVRQTTKELLLEEFKPAADKYPQALQAVIAHKGEAEPASP